MFNIGTSDLVNLKSHLLVQIINDSNLDQPQLIQIAATYKSFITDMYLKCSNKVISLFIYFI